LRHKKRISDQLSAKDVINTPLQRGDRAAFTNQNCFNSFSLLTGHKRPMIPWRKPLKRFWASWFDDHPAEAGVNDISATGIASPSLRDFRWRSALTANKMTAQSND